LRGDEIGQLFRQESARAVATIAKTFGDLELAEETVQQAYDRPGRQNNALKPTSFSARACTGGAIEVAMIAQLQNVTLERTPLVEGNSAPHRLRNSGCAQGARIVGAPCPLPHIAAERDTNVSDLVREAVNRLIASEAIAWGARFDAFRQGIEAGEEITEDDFDAADAKVKAARGKRGAATV